ncbi:TIGR03761 family integrating conjugative element protein [Pseudomonas aeruginosa]
MAETHRLQIGSLRSDVALTLHTYHAARIWTGRQKSDAKHSILGLSGFCAYVNRMHRGAAQDDPYSDWWLVQIEEKVESCQAALKAIDQRLDDVMAKLPATLDISENLSVTPVKVPLFISNPLGFKAVYLLTNYDELARRILLAQHVGLVGRRDMEVWLDEGASVLRSLFGLAQSYQFSGATRDGFTLLCMGFTGKEAMHWKVAYINAFNKMEQAIIEQPEILSHNHLLQFAIKTLDLMRDHTLGEPARPRTEQVVCNYLAVESLDAATPEQIKQALNFLQGQIIGEGVAAKSLPSVAGSSIAKDLLYGLLRSAHDAELLFNSLYDSGVEKLASEVFKEHMANTLAATSRQTRELLGYVASRATRSPFKPRSTH